MLVRFCLYGFLKNQQYYDAFLILAFRAKGLSFTEIGLLIRQTDTAVPLYDTTFIHAERAVEMAI